MRAIATTILLWLTLIVGELHTLWENSSVNANWIISDYIPMTMQWNVKLLGDEVILVLLALAILMWKDNRINRTAVRVYLIYAILDFALYFYNYKQKGIYEWVYLMVIISWVLIYNHYGKRSRTTNGQGTIIKT